MRRRIGLLLAVSALAGCSMEPAYHTPAMPAPPSWPVGDAYLKRSEAALPSYSYRDVFADPRLRAVLDQALANNEDVKTALANIDAARARYNIQHAELLPELDAGAGFRRTKSGPGSPTNEFNAQLSVTGYELDIFGRIRSLTGAARDRYLASESAARTTRLTLVSDTADAWIAYGLDKSLLEIARNTAEAARESVRLTQRRLDGGVAPRSDLRQAQIVLETANADIANQTTLVAQDLNALQLLVGAPIDPALLPAGVEDAGAQLREVPAGLDSTVLLRRPDVIEAEFQLKAANAEIGAARAAMFPKISLTSLLGFASTALGGLFTSGGFTWQGAATGSYSIFSGGAGKANVRLSKAQRDVALSAYRKAIESAFANVADTLARRGTIDAQLRASRASRDAAADNLHLADLRYRNGIESFLESLTARRALYSAEISLANTQRLRASNLVALYRSLGGDPFEATPAPIVTASDNHSQ